METQSFWKTNIDYVTSRESIRRCAVSFDEGEKGMCTFRLPEHKHVRAQLTVNGFLMFHGGSALEHIEILDKIASYVKAENGELKIGFSSYSPSDRELRRWRRFTRSHACAELIWKHPWMFRSTRTKGLTAQSNALDALYSELAIEELNNYFLSRFYGRLRFTLGLFLGRNPKLELSDALVDSALFHSPRRLDVEQRIWDTMKGNASDGNNIGKEL